MPRCEHCQADKLDVRLREYRLPLVADPAAASPISAASKMEQVSICDDCAREIGHIGSDARIWLEKRGGEVL
jgi:hypothetical protein